MFFLPPHIYLIGAFIAWIGLIITWAKHLRDVTEQRRIKAVANGERPPDIKGVSNYERAMLRDMAHRAQHITKQEKWIGRVLFFGIPVLIFRVFLTQS